MCDLGLLFAAARPTASARAKHMLNKRMKSFSLDTPDVPKPVDSSTKIKSNSYTNNTCIPGNKYLRC